MRRMILFSLLLLCIGCGKPAETPKTVAQLRDVAVAARDEAKSAEGPEAAELAAKKAEEAAAAAAELAQQAAGGGAEENSAVEEAAEAAREARSLAELAREGQRLAELTSGWTARAYRGTRRLAFRTVFKALALAADQAAGADMASLPQGVQDSATLAADLAGRLAGRKSLPDGKPDWPGIASDLNGFADQPPVEVALLAALGCVFSGRSRLALWEIELVDPAALKTSDQVLHYHLVRGVVLSQNELRRLALLELEEVRGLAAGGSDPGYGPQTLAGLHLLLAWYYLNDQRYRQADLELARAVQIWPNNPVAVYLTGERLAADGQYKKAADCLERACRDTKQQQRLAERIARRAREVRDGKETAEPLLTDFGFLRDVAVGYVADAAKESEGARRLGEWLTTATQFGKRLLVHVPGTEAWGP